MDVKTIFIQDGFVLSIILRHQLVAHYLLLKAFPVPTVFILSLIGMESQESWFSNEAQYLRIWTK